MTLHVDRVPQRESGMTPYEIMLSESQERMLVVCERGREHEIEAIFGKWDLHASCIGEVTREPRVKAFWHGELVAGRGSRPSRARRRRAGVSPGSPPARLSRRDGAGREPGG